MDEQNDIFDMGGDVSGESVNNQEVATPGTEESVNNQEVATPGVQSVEENERYAAARRAAERQRDIAVAQARADAEQYIGEVIGGLGLINPYTNTPIRSREELDDYREKHTQESKDELYERLGISREDMSKIVSESPEVKEMRAFLNASKRQENERIIRSEIAEINQLDPGANYKTVGDILNSDVGPDFRKYVEVGNSFINAYKLANMDNLLKKERAAGHQQALNGMSGKNHLTVSTAQGEGLIPVPTDVLNMYKELNPGMSDVEIQREYNKYQKKKG